MMVANKWGLQLNQVWSSQQLELASGMLWNVQLSFISLWQSKSYTNWKVYLILVFLIKKGGCDGDYAGVIEDRKSIFVHVFMMSLGVISWESKKQQVVYLSITDTELFGWKEYFSCCIVSSRDLYKFIVITVQPFNSMNPVLYGRSKHIDVRYYFLLDLGKERVVELVYCHSKD